jgi:hypothetical protein
MKTSMTSKDRIIFRSLTNERFPGRLAGFQARWGRLYQFTKIAIFADFGDLFTALIDN